MERNEALLYLPVGEGELLEDVYEQKIFEWKNFFVNRFPISKLFGKKLEQLKKLDEAYRVMGGVPVSSVEHLVVDIQFEVDFKQAFLKYAEHRNQMKARLFAAHSAMDILTVVNGLLTLTRSYAKVWTSSGLETKGIVISKEVDPMDLLSAIEDAASQGVQTITEIGKLPEGHLVLNEAKRLSLWTKMEENE